MKFPTYIQLDRMDCGPTCLRIISAYYGKYFSLKDISDKCPITNDGISILGLSEGADSIGFRTNGVKIMWEHLCEDIKLPCIVHWNQMHYVVVYKIKKRGKDYQIYISDPAQGLLKYSKESFMNSWASINTDDTEPWGIALLLEPTQNFFQEKDSKNKKINFKFLCQYLSPYRKYSIQLIFALVTGSILSAILPFLTQSIVDSGINNNNINFIVIILIAQVMLVFGQMANNLIRNWLMLHITVRISISLISDFLRKLMLLPIAFFDTKMVGDIMQRINDHSRIQEFLTGALLSIIMALVSFIIYSIVMAIYNIKILIIFIIGSACYIIWVTLFMKKRRELDYKRFQETSANHNSIIQLISGMQDIKLNNCEKQKRWEWERIQVKLYKVRIKDLTLSQTQTIGGTFIDQLKNVIISFIAAQAVISGNMTIGMMMALQYIIGQLNAPISQFITFVQSSQDAKISLERLNEIHEKEEEESEKRVNIKEIPLSTDIEFKNVTFQYEGRHSEKVLNNINLKIPKNKITAIVGASGSGKTTLLKLILGFYQPVEGEVLLANKSIEKYSCTEWRKCCGVVMQEGYLFYDTITNNIGISDEEANLDRVMKAVKAANLNDLIETLPLGYNTMIGAAGHGLSTGQKQRILIARAAYKNAHYLVFDEATNALDANNEKIIMENLNQFFKDKTVIIVAHRLSTVRNADKIVVLNKGYIEEEGTHEELVKIRGSYFHLVRNQLELEK